jgi:hypothetical protein
MDTVVEPPNGSNGLMSGVSDEKFDNVCPCRMRVCGQQVPAQTCGLVSRSICKKNLSFHLFGFIVAEF